MVQSITNNVNNDLANKNTFYFRERKQTKPFEDAEFLLTTEKSLSNDLTIATFLPASQIEQMQIKSIQQSEFIPKEFIAKVKTGKNHNSFYLGQKFGYIVCWLFILLFGVGVVDSESVPPGPIGLKQKQYTTTGYNCHDPISIRYIDKEQRCDPSFEDVVIPKEINWDILVHPLKQVYNGFW